MPESMESPKKENAAAEPKSLPAAIVSIIPSLLWFALAATVVFVASKPMLELLNHGGFKKIGIGVVQLEFAEVQLRRIRGLKEQGISEADQKVLLGRFRQLSDQLQATSILWVDDNHPAQNASLRPLLASLGVNVDLATSTDDALKWMGQAYYDIVITDLYRPNDVGVPCYHSSELANAGCALLKKVGDSRRGDWPKLIVYAGEIDVSLGTPPFAEGATNRPGALLNLILDAVAREQK